MISKFALPVLAIVAAPSMSALAQEFSLPAGCDGYLTIQSADCEVSHYFMCNNYAPGEQGRATLTEEGLSYVGRINSEAEWIESFHLRTGHTERLAQSVDPMSISELMANDLDTWDFTTASAEIGDTRYVGMDRLTGESAEIDGITLLRTEYQIISYDVEGNEVWSATGREFISPEWRMFIGGESSYTTSEGTFDSDSTPVEFIFPGESGFMSINPKYGCGVQMSSFEIGN